MSAPSRTFTPRRIEPRTIVSVPRRSRHDERSTSPPDTDQFALDLTIKKSFTHEHGLIDVIANLNRIWPGIRAYAKHLATIGSSIGLSSRSATLILEKVG